MSLTAPYIWIMISGVYDVLQIYDIDGSASYFDIYCNGTKVYTLDKYDDISYVTIEDLELEDKVTPGLDYFSIGVIAYDEDGNKSEKSNTVLWYHEGVFDNNCNDPDIWSPFQETSKFYFYLDGVRVYSSSKSYIFSESSELGYDGTLSVRLSPVSSTGIIIELTNSSTNGKRLYTYNYDVPISSATISSSTFSSTTSSLSIYVYAISGDERYAFKRLCYNNDLIDAENVGFRHHGKRDITCNDCLSFISDTNNFTLAATSANWNGTLEYSTDKMNWAVWDGSEIGSLNQKLYLRGYNNTKFYRSSGVRFRLSAPAGCYGNINTLLEYTNPPKTIEVKNCYRDMFNGCRALTHAPELPATTLAEYCYYQMFCDCTSLTQAPKLPATTLAESCYYLMFYGCTSLTQAPELPATTLAKSCYRDMFNGCRALTHAPELPATTLAEHCYYQMFCGCTNLTHAPELPTTTLAESCYFLMFYGCTSLTQAPELPATTLYPKCYRQMFSGCTSLTHAPELPATTLAEYCYYQMFYGCTSLTQAHELPATTLAESCYGGMFCGCTSLTHAPELPATTLAESCYGAMFSGCTSLTHAPELPATTLAEYCYSQMFQRCTSLTQAHELPATTLAKYCYSAMFQRCTSLTHAPELPATTLAEYCYRDMFNGCRALTHAPELPATTLAEYCYSAMFSGCSKIKLSTTQTYEYTQEYRIPTSGDGTTATSALSGMFSSTGGTFTGTPEINTTYYLHSSNTIV